MTVLPNCSSGWARDAKRAQIATRALRELLAALGHPAPITGDVDELAAHADDVIEQITLADVSQVTLLQPNLGPNNNTAVSRNDDP